LGLVLESFQIVVIAPTDHLYETGRLTSLLKLKIGRKSVVKFYAKKSYIEQTDDFIYKTAKSLISETKNRFFFLYDDASDYFKSLRRILTKETASFLVFSDHFYKNDALIISKYAVDFGSAFRDFGKIKKRAKKHPPKMNMFKYPDLKTINKIKIIPPLNFVEHRHLFKFRSAHTLAKQIISILSLTESHNPVEIFETDPGKIHMWKKAFGKRAVFINSLNNINKDDLVLTWNTKSFFHFMKIGVTAIPLTKCLAEQLFKIRYKDNLKDIITKRTKINENLDPFITFINNDITLSEENNYLSKKLQYIIYPDI